MWGSEQEKDGIEVQLLAERFAWHFRYPGPDGRFDSDDDMTPATLVVPLGRQVRLKMRSKDVLHSVFLPHMRIKQDVIPGMQTSMYFTANQTGTYEIACAELCGNMHTNMRGVLKVVTEEEYEAWRKRYGKTFRPNVKRWKNWDKGVRKISPAKK
jgi:cytochrome c oxidase subunit 2